MGNTFPLKPHEGSRLCRQLDGARFLDEFYRVAGSIAVVSTNGARGVTLCHEASRRASRTPWNGRRFTINKTQQNGMHQAMKMKAMLKQKPICENNESSKVSFAPHVIRPFRTSWQLSRHHGHWVPVCTTKQRTKRGIGLVPTTDSKYKHHGYS